MAYVLKIKYENNLRRITLQQREIESESFSFTSLETRIRELFQLPATAPLAITYTDEESDVVTMGNDQDLKDALIEQELNPLRIHVTLSKSKSKDEAPEAGKDVEAAAKSEPAEEGMRRVLAMLAQTPVTMKHALQAYEPLLEGVKSPAQIRALVDNVLQTVFAQVSAALKNGSSAAFGGPSPLPPASGGPSLFPYRLPSGWVAPPPYRRSHPPPPSPSGDSAASAGPSSVPEGSDSENQTVHHGVTCDECGVSPIVGSRWKSLLKFDFDLCSDCFAKHGDEREYTKIEQPKFRPRHMMHGYPRHPFHHMGPMGPSHFHLNSPHGSHGPHGHFHGGWSFGMRGPFSGFGGRHHCAPHPSADKLYARFVCDVTVFDGTEVAPGTHFVKIWRLRNSGASPWPTNTSLVFVGGDELGHVSPVPLEIPEQGLAPEAEMEASVDMVSPEKPGRYVSHWRLASPAGPKFGQRLSVIIQVLPKTTFDGVPAESVSVGDDAPAVEVESAAGRTTSQTPAGELAEGGEVTVKQVGSLTMFSFGNIEGKNSVPDVAQPEKEQVDQKEVPTPAQSGDFGGGLISMVGDDAVDSAKELAAMTEAGDKATEGVAPIPTLAELWAEAISSAKELEEVTAATELTKKKKAGGEDYRAAVESLEASNVYKTFAEASKTGGMTTEIVARPDLAEQTNSLLAETGETGKEVAKSMTPSLTLVDSLNLSMAAFKVPEKSPVEEGAITYPKLEEVTQDEGPITYPVVDTAVAEAAEPLEGEDLSTSKALLAKLEAMGFIDAKLNYELLAKNAFDLRKTLDDLCAAEEWDPILEELEEMGFYDTVMNRRLMFKNNGSVKRVVKELVQMYRDIQGKREKVE